MSESIRRPDLDFSSARTLAALREALRVLHPPTIVFNKSHSGSRVVARLLSLAGVYMGAELNDSDDAVALLPLIERCVEDYYPDYDVIRRGSPADATLAQVAAEGFCRHLANYTSGPWGWKLSETGFALPVLLQLFPEARCIHIIRDGRDVAFANHVAPRNIFWRKVFIDNARERFRDGLIYGRFSRTLYRLLPHRYNAQHWINSVTTFRRFTAGLGDRLLEVRYEDLPRNFADEAERICSFARAPNAAAAIAELTPTIRSERVGRFQREAKWKQHDVLRRTGPLLKELGYLDEP